VTASFRQRDLLAETELDPGTAGLITTPKPPSRTQISIKTRTGHVIDQVQVLREQIVDLNTRAGDVHEESYLLWWETRADELMKLASTTVLDELSDLGFSWRDVAKMMRVSVPAVQKWRRDGGMTAESRRNLAELDAGCELIQERGQVEDVASWFEVPLHKGAPITPIDLWAAGEAKWVFKRAVENVSPETILDEVHSGWRERYTSNFETFRDEDGQLSVRMKD